MGSISSAILAKPKPVKSPMQLDEERSRNMGLTEPAVVVADKPVTPDLTSGATTKDEGLKRISPSPALVGQAEVSRPEIIMPQKEAQPLSYVEMMQRLSPYKPMSQEEIDAEKARQKRNTTFSALGDAIGAFANLYGTSNGAINAYNPQTSMSAKNKSYWDDLNKERQANQDRYNQLMLQAMQMDQRKADSDRNYRQWLEEMQLSRNKFDFSKSQYEDEKARDQRDYQYKVDESNRQQANIEANRKQDQDQFIKNYNLSAAKFAQEKDENYNTFSLSDGTNLKLPKSVVNNQTIGRIFAMLPQEVQDKFPGEPVYDTDGWGNRIITGHGQPNVNTMLAAIGAYSHTTPKDGQVDPKVIDEALTGLANRNKGKGY